MPSNQSAGDYLRVTTDKVINLVMHEINECPGIKALVATLNSLGIVCLLEHSVNVKLIVQEGFQPPRDLSQHTPEEINELFFSPEDDAELKRILGGIVE